MNAFPIFKFFIKLIMVSMVLQGCENGIDNNSKTKVSPVQNDLQIISMSSKSLPEFITRLSFGSCLSEKEDHLKGLVNANNMFSNCCRFR